MIIWGDAGKFGRPIHRKLTSARRSDELFQIVAGEDEPMRPTGELKTIVGLNRQRAFPECRWSADGFALSARVKENGSD